jgi:hypothetical protein
MLPMFTGTSEMKIVHTLLYEYYIQMQCIGPFDPSNRYFMVSYALDV